MIQRFVDRFMAKRDDIRARFAAKHPSSYEDIVRAVIAAVSDDGDYGEPNPDNIHTINDGDYQGTLLFVIPENAYQPHDYWYVRVFYGSCSGCDTLEAILSETGYGDVTPTESQVDQYMTLALHVVQGLKSMQDDE